MRLKESDMPSEGEWEEYFKPKETLAKLGLRKGMAVADLGCGYGTFTLAAAEGVGEAGFVYAMDIDPRMVRRVRRRSTSDGFKNVRAIVGDLTSLQKSRLPKGSIDFVLFANVIHGTSAKVELLKDVAKILRQWGHVAVLNWKLCKTPRGPPMRIRPTTRSIVLALERAGFRNIKVKDIPPHHYGVVAQAPNKEFVISRR